MESLKRVKLKDLYVLFIFIYFISLPLGAISLGSFGSALRLLAVVPIALAFFAKRFTLTPPLSFHALFVFISLAATLWSVNIDTSFSRITSYFLLLMLLVSGCCFELDEKDIAKIKAALEWSSILTAALMMLFAKTVNGRLRLNDIIVEDPNYICAYLFFGIPFSSFKKQIPVRHSAQPPITDRLDKIADNADVFGRKVGSTIIKTNSSK